MRGETFPRYQDRCGWNALLPRREPREAAHGDIEADYLIIGGGYTGLAAARRLSERAPHAHIVVLEATEIGEGSSGRNSGFASPHESALGVSDAQLPHVDTLIACLNEGFSYLTSAMEKARFGCDLEKSGRLTAAATELGFQKLAGMAARGIKLHVPHRLLDRDALRTLIGTDYYQCGLHIDEGYLLQPASLVRGLADHLPISVRLYENSPVLHVEKKMGWNATTPHARVHCKHLMFATNAAMKNFGYWRDRLVTIYTYAGLTEEMSAPDAAQLGARVWGALPAHRLGTTLRRVGENRFLVRSLYSYEKPLRHDAVVSDLTLRFHRRYPMLKHVRLEHVWGGTTALTMNGAPRWGQVDDGLFAAAGCNGSGIVKGTLLGKRIADMMVTGAPQDDISVIYGQANWIAPEPFRTVGFRVISAFERRKAGLEQ